MEAAMSTGVPRQRWASEVVEGLAEYRRRGVKRFDVAWSYTLSDLPVPWSWLGPPRLTLFPSDADGDELAPVDFFRGQCELQWNGLGEVIGVDLRSLLASMIDASSVNGRRAGSRPTLDRV